MRLAFCGGRGTHKTTLSEWLKTDHNFYVYSFARPIKEIIHIIWKTPWDLLLYNKTPEIILKHIKIGEGLKKMFYEDIWIDCLHDKISIPISYGSNIIVDDLRFKNEELYLRAQGFTIIILEKEQDYEPYMYDHYTENQRLTWDYVVNTGNMDEAKEEILKIMEGLEVRQK